MPKIYDCFSFFNESDLLEIRLNELSNVVDYFVIVEATRTFMKKEKPLLFDITDPRFIKFKERIIHIVVDDFPNFFTHWRIPKCWDYENHQKNAIERGLVNAAPDDIIIISDIDEIPNPTKILKNISRQEPVIFQQRLFYYFLNYVVTHANPESCIVHKNGIAYWRGSVMIRKRDFTNTQSVRKLRDDLTQYQEEEGGWHFSYIGGIESIIYKLKSFSHAKEAKQILHNIDDKEKITKIIASGHDIFNRDMSFKALPLTEPFPKYIKDHIEKYQTLICPSL